jgi:nicotinate-nucleotide pyrophosphorylase (carboxylating)
MDIDLALIRESVAVAIEEDVATGDVTASLIPENELGQATVICRDEAVICGIPWFNEVFAQIDAETQIKWHCEEGDKVAANTVICSIEGNARSMLTAERAALNFLQTLSATATATRHYVDEIQHTKTRILDTRKTIPGLRRAQKYAVACGGGKNHRIGLYDMILIKENHIMAAGSIAAAVEQARLHYPDLKVEVETESLQEYGEAVSAGADIVMLDNFSLEDMRQAVQMNESNHILLEASGGVNLTTVKAIAETGVDYISVGDITKSVNAVDLSLRFRL